MCARPHASLRGVAFAVVSRGSCTCQSAEQARQPRTCRPDCIPNPCGQTDSEGAAHSSHTLGRPGDLALCVSPGGKSPDPLPPLISPLPRNDHTEFQVIRMRMFRFCRLSRGPQSDISSCSAITNARRGYTLRK